MRSTAVKKMKEKKNLKNLSPEMANILSNFEVAYKKKKKCIIFPNYFRL